MKELVYKQLKKDWNYAHPLTKVLMRIDYFLERIRRKTHKAIQSIFRIYTVMDYR